MKRPAPFHLDIGALRTELAAFKQLLSGGAGELSEREQILPFFKQHLNLAALLGCFNAQITRPDRCQPELALFGEHSCDLLVGQSDTQQYCFVEFEDAQRNSVFQLRGKGTADWATRLEHGFSQVIDWFRTLAGESHGTIYREFFGGPLADYCALIVIGRDAFLQPAELERLRWRSNNVSIAGKRVHLITFDDLLRNLESRVSFLLPGEEPIVKKPKRRTPQ